MSWEEAKNQLRNVKLQTEVELPSGTPKNETKSTHESVLPTPTILSKRENEVATITTQTPIAVIKDESITPAKKETVEMKNNAPGTLPEVKKVDVPYTREDGSVSHGVALPSFYETLQAEESASLSLTRSMSHELHGLMTKLIHKKEDNEFQRVHSGDINDICKIADTLTKVIKTRTEITRTALNALKGSR